MEARLVDACHEGGERSNKKASYQDADRAEKIEGSYGEREVLIRAALRQPSAAAQKPDVKLRPPMHEAGGSQEAAKGSTHQRVVRLGARALVAVMRQNAV